jgi:hypothetical protein
MKVKLLAGLLLAGAIPLVFSACKDDEEPKKTGISLEKTAEEVMESDGTAASFHPDLWEGSKGHDVLVKLVLDRPLSEAVVLTYSLSGTATNENAAGELLVNDYALKDGTNTSVGSDRITIAKGATEATIKLTVYEDYILLIEEYDEAELETVVLKLESVESGPAVLGTSLEYTLTIREDDSIIFLSWMDETTEEIGDIDMDLFLWNDGIMIDASANENAEDPDDTFEVLLLPGGYPEGDYGLSYTYYDGTSDNVIFAGVMYGYFNGEFYNYEGGEDILAYGGNYTTANLNTYGYDDTSGELVPPPLVVQTLTKEGVYYEVSEIDIPAEGSRSGNLLSGSRISPKELKRFQDLQVSKILSKKNMENFGFGKINLTK